VTKTPEKLENLAISKLLQRIAHLLVADPGGWFVGFEHIPLLPAVTVKPPTKC